MLSQVQQLAQGRQALVKTGRPQGLHQGKDVVGAAVAGQLRHQGRGEGVFRPGKEDQFFQLLAQFRQVVPHHLHQPLGRRQSQVLPQLPGLPGEPLVKLALPQPVKPQG